MTAKAGEHSQGKQEADTACCIERTVVRELWLVLPRSGMSDEERAELDAMRAREAQWEAHLDAQVGGTTVIPPGNPLLMGAH